MSYNPAQQFVPYGGVWGFSDGSKKLSYKFTAQKNGTVDEIKICTTFAGSPPLYRAGIQGDSDGEPDGSYDGSGTFTPSKLDFSTVTLDNPVSVTQGTIYHIVVQYESGDIDTSNCGHFYMLTILNSLIPYDQSSDTNQNTLIYSGSWASQDYSPIYILVFDDSSLGGQPYIGWFSGTVQGNIWISQKHTMCENVAITHFGAYVEKNNDNTPLDDLYYEIQNSEGGTLRSGTLVTAGTVTTDYVWYDVALDSSLTLEGGETYRFVLNSPDSDSSDYFRWWGAYTDIQTGDNTITYQGITSFRSASSTGGSSWTDYQAYDMCFRMTVDDSIIFQDNDDVATLDDTLSKQANFKINCAT